MPALRLAYAAIFLIALIAVYTLWGQVGGQGHLDLLPWYVRLVLGCGAAVAFSRAAYFASKREEAWNGGTLKWGGVFLALLLGCGLAAYFAHLYLEEDNEGGQESITSLAAPPRIVEVYEVADLRHDRHSRVRANVCRVAGARRHS